MHTYAWTIIAFRQDEKKNVSYANYLFCSQAPTVADLEMEIQKALDEKFPEVDGWFERSYSILGITVEYDNSRPGRHYKLPLARLN